jgi:hypothetical protein
MSRRTSASSKSYVVTMPTSLSPSTIGKQLILCSPICAAADSMGSSGDMVIGLGVIDCATVRSRIAGTVAPSRPMSVIEMTPTSRPASTTGR